MSDPYQGQSANPNVPGITGENTAGQNSVGVKGVVQDLGWGVLGESTTGTGVVGISQTSFAIFAKSEKAAGILAESTNADGVFGVSHSPDAVGVSGHNDTGTAVWGGSKSGRGVAGFSETWQGVYGHSVTQAGVVGESDQFDGVFGISHSDQHAGVTGNNTAGGMAGFFDGNVVVTGDIQMLGGDVAEDFDVEEDEEIPPGAVVSLGDSGSIRLARRPYDTAIIGIVSGAVGFRPALRLDRISTGHPRLPVALVGKVMCLVDASSSPVRAGDLLTSSVTPGYAMRAEDAHQSVGAIVGKALRSLDRGQALLPVLAILQ